MRSINYTQYGAIGEFLKDNIETNSKLKITSSYFTIYAFNELKEQLERSKEVKFLFNEPTFVKNLLKGERLVKEFQIEREKSVSEFPWEINLKNNLNQNRVAKACAKFIEEKAEVKSIKNPNYLLDNSFHISNIKDPFMISGNNIDFTQDGLGYSERPKIQFTPVNEDKNILEQYSKFFDSIWNDPNIVEDVKEELLIHIKNLYQENSPELLYFVTLYNLFNEKLVNEDEISKIKDQTGVRDSKVWKMLYNFQLDAAVGAIKKLETYNGCIIADSVGLGKTFEALAVIKYYELRNYRVLVLAPKKLRNNWTSFKMNTKTNPVVEDRFRYDVLNHTDLSRTRGFSGDIDLSQINWGNYDLIVIDESHNFRNNNPVKGKQTRYEKLMDDLIKSGVKTKVLMLSATPVNTSLKDLRNQILFATEGNDDAFEKNLNIPSIEHTLRIAQTEFNKWSENKDSKVKDLIPKLSYDFFNLLNALTIARSRRHIEKYYDTKEIGEFPTRLKPKSIKTDIDTENNFPTMEVVNNEISKLHLSIYSPLHYVLPSKLDYYRKKYDQVVKDGQSVFSQEDRENSLVNLMRVNILKRLESSVESFRLTITRIYEQTENMIVKINQGMELDLESSDDEEDDDLDELMIGNKVQVKVQDLDKIRIIQDLEEDLKILNNLLKSAKDVTPDKDLKLQTLKDEIRSKIERPINLGNNKVIVFTAFSDTASYLYKELENWMKEEFGLYSGIVTGSSETKNNIKGVQNSFESNLVHFSPKSNKIEVKNEISLLVATDCISEGQNLQDCDYLVNYDIHWNPVRIVQRFGRIDRIGSENKEIQLVNFWPNMELDEYINLEQRVRGRMVMMDLSATGEDDLLNPESKDLNYRKEQLQQLQEDVVDIEDLSGGISITDLNLDDFIMNLEQFMKKNPNMLERYPTGIYAISSIPERLNDELVPGVIFCLKQKDNNQEKKQSKNSLHPYHLVYIDNEEDVVVSHNNPKKILDLYKGISTSEKEINYNLVSEFNKETDEGYDMSHYTNLLEKAINDIKGIEEEKGIQSLFTLGESNLLEQSISGVDNFELVTFLVIT